MKKPINLPDGVTILGSELSQPIELGDVPQGIQVVVQRDGMLYFQMRVQLNEDGGFSYSTESGTLSNQGIIDDKGVVGHSAG